MVAKDYDFSGWVTKNDILCSDGVTIRHNAFIENDGQTVPLVWNHNHSGPEHVLGTVLLRNEDNGVYGYGYFNDSERAKNAKELIRHGDIGYMSIAANHIKRSPQNDVLHGRIYEVSLVYTAANPGAMIESVITHSDDNEDGETVFMYGMSDSLLHSRDSLSPDEQAKAIAEDADDELVDIFERIVDSLTDEQMMDVVDYVSKLTGKKDESMFDSLTDEQEDDVIEYVLNNFKMDSADAKAAVDGNEKPQATEEQKEDELVQAGENKKPQATEEQKEDELVQAGENDDFEAIVKSLTEDELNKVLDYMRTFVKDKNVRIEDLVQRLTDEDYLKVREYIINLRSEKKDIKHSEDDGADAKSDDDDEVKTEVKALSNEKLKKIKDYAESLVDSVPDDKDIFDVLTNEQMEDVVRYAKSLGKTEEDGIEHTGQKGMKWGVRRYQNPDGSLTPLGREHYGVGMDERIRKGAESLISSKNNFANRLTDRASKPVLGMSNALSKATSKKAVAAGLLSASLRGNALRDKASNAILSKTGNTITKAASGFDRGSAKMASALSNVSKENIRKGLSGASSKTVLGMSNALDKGSSKLASALDRGSSKMSSALNKGSSKMSSAFSNVSRDSIRKGIYNAFKDAPSRSRTMSKTVLGMSNGLDKGSSKLASALDKGSSKMSSALNKGSSKINNGLNRASARLSLTSKSAKTNLVSAIAKAKQGQTGIKAYNPLRQTGFKSGGASKLAMNATEFLGRMPLRESERGRSNVWVHMANKSSSHNDFTNLVRSRIQSGYGRKLLK